MTHLEVETHIDRAVVIQISDSYIRHLRVVTCREHARHLARFVEGNAVYGSHLY